MRFTYKQRTQTLLSSAWSEIAAKNMEIREHGFLIYNHQETLSSDVTYLAIVLQRILHIHWSSNSDCLDRGGSLDGL